MEDAISFSLAFSLLVLLSLHSLTFSLRRFLPFFVFALSLNKSRDAGFVFYRVDDEEK